jgi:hypothetical protein
MQVNKGPGSPNSVKIAYAYTYVFINNYISYVVIQVPKASCMGQLFYDSNFAALIAILCETNIEQIFEN